MSYRTTTSYGTWCNQINTYSTSPDADVVDFIGGGDYEWQQRLEASGALETIQNEYRAAINEALPPSISLCGDEFIGPAHPDDDEFDGYPTDEYGSLDLKALVEDIDLTSILERNEPLTAEEIGRDEMKSQAKEPGKTASKAMARLGVRPFIYLPNPDSGQPQALYRAGEVRAALANRPGRGTRTDLNDSKA